MTSQEVRSLHSLVPKIPRGVFVAGTDTGVGKTEVACGLLRAMTEQGIDARALKPVETGWPAVGPPAPGSDSHRLWEASRRLPEVLPRDGDPEYTSERVAFDRFEAPVSPHIAYRESRRALDITELRNRLQELAASGRPVVVESAGGALTPLSSHHLTLDLALGLGLPLLIVTDRRLGVFSRTLLIVEAARSRGLDVAAIVVNAYDASDDCLDKEAAAAAATELSALTGLRALVFALNSTEADEAAASGDRPGNTAAALSSDLSHVWHPFTQYMEHIEEHPPLVIERAEGNYLIDAVGRRYLDGVSSLWVNLHGHREPRIDRAVRRQLGKVAHSTMLGLVNPVAAKLAEKLCELAPEGLSRVFYSDSGSTSVEAAMKIAVQYQAQSGHPERTRFMSFEGAYHGDTLGAVAVGGHELFHSKYRSMLFPVVRSPNAYCYRCPLGCSPDECESACLAEFERNFAAESHSLAAVVIEPLIQGAAGMIPWPKGLLSRVRRVTEEAGVLLIADEVATGFGRTGTLFACEQESVSPDLMCLAKGISGGYLPLAATLATEKVFRAFDGRYSEHRTFYHGHSYTGNPLACAAGLASLRIFKDDSVMERVSGELIPHLATALQSIAELPNVGDIRRVGTMTGIELVRDRESREPFDVDRRIGREVCIRARHRGIVIRPLGDVIVLMPPLSITPAEVDLLVSATSAAITEVTSTVPGRSPVSA